MDTPSDLGTLTATEVIDGVRAAREDEHEAQLRQLQLAVAWALLHPCADTDDAAGWHDQRGLYDGIAPLAGSGAPAGRRVRPRLARRRPSASPWTPHDT